MGATTVWHQLAARLALRRTRCNRVQPIFFMKFTLLVRNHFHSTKSAEYWCICFWIWLFLLRKGAKNRRLPKNAPGATNSHETGCTLFALLNSIHAQGATNPRVRFIG
jgi:hypothetical protein